MKFLRFLFLALLALLLAACGGSSNNSTGVVSQVSAAGYGSTLVVRLTDLSGNVIGNNTLNLNSASYYVQAQAHDISGNALQNQLITFLTNPSYASFQNGTTTVVVTSTSTSGSVTTATMASYSGITDSTGTAKAQMVGTALGAATVSASTTAGATALTTTMAYQVVSAVAATPAGLQFVSASPAALMVTDASTGSKQSIVSFEVLNQLGSGVANQAVTLSLNQASLVAGVTFIVNGASTTGPITVTSGLNGLVTATVGAGSLPTGVVVKATLVSNTAVTASSVGLSVSNGRIAQKSMSISASSPAVEGFNIDNISTDLTVIATDRMGNPIPVGTVMNFITSNGLIGTFTKATTTVIVTTNPAGTTASSATTSVVGNGSATVTSSSSTGTATTVTNVVITASTGTCVMDASSSCKVRLISSGPRPANGLVTVLAYSANGEESFIDLLGTNQYVVGDPFTDMGIAYLDVNGNGVYETGVDQPVPGGMTGTATCAGSGISIANTCDGIWSSSIYARQRYTVTWSTSAANIQLYTGFTRTLSQFQITVLDLNGNSLAYGSTISASALNLSPTSLCKVVALSPVSSSPVPGLYNIFLNGDPSCAAGGSTVIQVIATSPSGQATYQDF